MQPIKEPDKLVNKSTLPTTDILKEVRVSPETLLNNAIKSGANVETIEKLMDLRERLKKEYARDCYYNSLTGFQSECPEIEKTKIVRAKNNVDVLYRYAPLENIVIAVRPLLEKYGFSFSFKTSQDDKFVTAICNVSHKLGHTEITEVKVPYDHGGFMNAAQRVGSALTYAKRYSFIDAFGIVFADSDDDGQGAGEKTETIKTENNKTGPVNVGALPEDNQIIYKNIMAVLNQKDKNGKPIFNIGEKTSHKKNTDMVANKLDELKQVLEVLNNIAGQRK